MVNLQRSQTTPFYGANPALFPYLTATDANTQQNQILAQRASVPMTADRQTQLVNTIVANTGMERNLQTSMQKSYGNFAADSRNSSMFNDPRNGMVKSEQQKADELVGGKLKEDRVAAELELFGKKEGLGIFGGLMQVLGPIAAVVAPTLGIPSILGTIGGGSAIAGVPNAVAAQVVSGVAGAGGTVLDSKTDGRQETIKAELNRQAAANAAAVPQQKPLVSAGASNNSTLKTTYGS